MSKGSSARQGSASSAADSPERVLCGRRPRGPVHLSQTRRSVEHGIPGRNVQDWRGKPVIDPEGSKIGELKAIYVDTGTDEPAFATVRVGMIGRHRLAFVPLSEATVTPNALRVQYSKKLVTTPRRSTPTVN
jgi:hypothetical protein